MLNCSTDLITLYSGLAAVERIAGLELMERNFVKPSRVAFNRLRRIVDLMFTDILETLEIEHTGQRPSNQDSALYQEPDIVDWERDADRPGRALDLSPSQYVEYQNTMEMREQITSVAARLRKEVQSCIESRKRVLTCSAGSTYTSSYSGSISPIDAGAESI